MSRIWWHALEKQLTETTSERKSMNEGENLLGEGTPKRDEIGKNNDKPKEEKADGAGRDKTGRGGMKATQMSCALHLLSSPC
jgi:hypothetical protein